MKVKRVEQTPVTIEELNLYKEKISKLKGFAFNALDVDIDKRIITLNFGGDYEELTLINPTKWLFILKKILQKTKPEKQ